MAAGDNTTNLDGMNLGPAPALPPAGDTPLADPVPPAADPTPPVADTRESLMLLTKAQLLKRAAEDEIGVPEGANKVAIVDLLLGVSDDTSGDTPPADPADKIKLSKPEAWARVDDARNAGVKPSLANCDLSGLDFTTAQHKRRNEGGRVVTDTVLIGYDFHGVDFTGAVLEGTVFINNNLQGAMFGGAAGTPVVTGADLRWATDHNFPVDEQSIGL